ncbi:Eco57I restriction-modification methylase domain-containing protein [Burkholderia pseudomallei]|uniref:Eco57I restriction-modification methylase domain-containing protein n=1 Tax=Burkholderia pseudomallei TaxID=28450 RepID=UPI000F05CD92|nr:N-6 DNA methylase [Burkholderia pseudomallei]CAJ4819446.1 Type I restriction-modification system methyltransferase subunit [Burkholderia pseudomallei]CAJ9364398.1 Type I restriction-modification system methyltransferase subunit [Burkholderia pseudomallei]VBB90249.1 Type I restriction-modification system methyltransferase subunit [Burkholderia pseudomallei]VBD73666.1 Type I restriction-modification system methyltransferase subunit [Burkholderia pseudomallei]VBE22872.1 Type I restriction-modi
MVTKRKTKAREAQLAFEALSIDGGLLSPEWLSKVAQLQAGFQAEADYRIPRGLNLRDEIGRYWRIAQAHWTDFKSGREGKADSRAVSERFLFALLRDAFGFTSLTRMGPAILAGRSYAIGHAALGGRVPVVIAAADSGLDTLATEFGAGGRKRSAFGLAQEFLNAQEDALWGIASDGASLRIVRDNASLTRPAWIEADLQRIFAEERYADFAALWLLCHETRFGREGQPVTECALEAWRNAGREEGTRAREHLRRGVEEALVALGQGFLAHAENQALRAELQNGALPLKDYFNQLLRMVYRLIFLLTVEERGLLHPDGTSDAAKALYADGYGMRRLRERSVKRSAHDRFPDLWEGTKVVFRGLASGESRIGLPALAGIFSTSQCRTLDGAKLENRALLIAMFKLSWLREDGSLSRVNWRDMGPEELGSVYESLLELVPQIARDGRQFAFATGGETKGNVRKTTGSYYTPDSLVQELLDSSLEPVIADTIAKNPVNPVDALLALSIVDPACGSGHFLLAAARRLAAHVARLQANGTPSASEYQHALRQVVGHCIFGVDLNPMAVELCKVGLWMEAVEPGMPLTFLNSHIQHGNALLGTTPELLAKGIPDAAWDPIEGDDKKAASALKKRNKIEAGGQRTLDFGGAGNSDDESEAVSLAVAELDAASDSKIDELTKKEERWDGILGSNEYRHQKLLADAWCAAFVWPKQSGDFADAAPTNELWRRLRDGQGAMSELTTKTVGELAEHYRFFHWHLQFPQVFKKGGFAVVLGNPPWDKIQPEEEKFFSGVRPDIAFAPTAKARKALIESLETDDLETDRLWKAYKRAIDCTCHFLSASKRLPLTAEGNLNSYRLFTEAAAQLVSPNGRVGLVSQSGIATDESGKEFFDHLLRSGRLCQFLDFENRENFFPDVDSRFRFCLITIRGSDDARTSRATFGWMLRSIREIKIEGRLIGISAGDLELFNPSSRTSPVFLSEREVVLSRRIYERGEHVMLDTSRRFAGVSFLGELFNMTRDSKYFNADSFETALQLYEAKFIHQFDHRFATVRSGDVDEVKPSEKLDPSLVTAPKSFVEESIVKDRTIRRGIPDRWMVGFRDIASATNERTAIAAVLPYSAVGNSINLVLGLSAQEAAFLVANTNSFVFDFCARQKISGTHVNIWIFKQLPAVPIQKYVEHCPWSGGGTSLGDWMLPRILELTYTSWDLEQFARDVGYTGTPFRWDAERRFLLRCELDAAFCHLYGLSRDDIDYIMDTFSIVRKNDEKIHGEYRTKRVILEIYSALAKAVQNGNTYQTPLDPSPAAPGASHGTFAPDGTPKDYAEALRTGLLFALIRRGGEGGISSGALGRALLWLQDSKHAASWLEDSALMEFEHIRESDALLAEGAADSQVFRLLDALETAKAITQDSKGNVRLRLGGTIPTWLPQTPALAKLASVLSGGLERAERGASATHAAETIATEKAKRA